MSRYIDIEPYEKDGWYLQKHYHNSYGEVIKTTPLVSVPTAEAEPRKHGELIRCKDCKWYYEKGALCNYWADVCEHAEVYPQISPIDFCSRGERKDEVTE